MPSLRYVHPWVRRWGPCGCCGKVGSQCRCHVTPHYPCRDKRSSAAIFTRDREIVFQWNAKGLDADVWISGNAHTIGFGSWRVAIEWLKSQSYIGERYRIRVRV